MKIGYVPLSIESGIRKTGVRLNAGRPFHFPNVSHFTKTELFAAGSGYDDMVFYMNP